MLKWFKRHLRESGFGPGWTYYEITGGELARSVEVYGDYEDVWYAVRARNPAAVQTQSLRFSGSDFDFKDDEAITSGEFASAWKKAVAVLSGLAAPGSDGEE